MGLKRIYDGEEIPAHSGLAREFIKGKDIDPRTGEEIIDDPIALLIIAVWNKVKELVKRKR